jgi:hypothetical protein
VLLLAVLAEQQAELVLQPATLVVLAARILLQYKEVRQVVQALVAVVVVH